MRNSALLLGRDLLGIASEMLEILNKIFIIIFIQVSQLRELIEVKEVITPYGRSGSEETIAFCRKT